MDELIERIENARSDADFWASEGKDDNAVVTLSREDCTTLGKFLTKVFGLVLMGKQNSEIADQLAILSGAFEGEGSSDDPAEAL
jgi:hypothetical protein